MSVATINKLTQLVSLHRHVQKTFTQVEEDLNDWEVATRLRLLGKKIKSDKLLLGPWPYDLEDKVSEIYKQLAQHFADEEDMLNECCDTFDHPDLISALSSQHWEHQELLASVSCLQERVREMVDISVTDRPHYAMAASSEIRECISGICVLLESHADEETRLFESLTLKLAKEDI